LSTCTIGSGSISRWKEIRQTDDLYNPLAESSLFRKSAAFTIVTNASYRPLSLSLRETSEVCLNIQPWYSTDAGGRFDRFHTQWIIWDHNYSQV
jgi:hypothetical protein